MARGQDLFELWAFKRKTEERISIVSFYLTLCNDNNFCGIKIFVKIVN